MRNNPDPEKKVIDFAKAHKMKRRQLSRKRRVLLAVIAVAAVVALLAVLLIAFQVNEALADRDFWGNFATGAAHLVGR